MQITINGEAREVPRDTTVAQLLQRLELNPKNVAVEINRRIAPREEHADRRLDEHDALEIVTLVGGG